MSFCCEACGCMPQCRPKCQNIQCPKLETILCGGNCWDYDNLMCIKTRRKKGRSPTDTLGNTIGVVKTQLHLKLSDTSGAQIGGQRFATYLKAFAYLYLSPEYEWNTGVLNLILKEGQKLYSESDAEEKRKSSEEKPKGTELMQLQTASNVYSSFELKVGRVFRLLENDFGIELSENFSLMDTLPGSSGDHLAPGVKMENLKRMLKEFFKKKNHCLVSINGWYVLIWKVRQIYFVLDVCGRRLDTFETDKDGGSVVLICLPSLDNVYHLIANLSGFCKTDTCTLREMKVVMMGGSDGSHQTPEYGERRDEYVIVNDDYAYLKSALHLSLKTDSPLRSRSALPVGVAALLAAKIDHPAIWTEKVLNKIICYGVSVCRFCWEQCLRSSEPIDFDCFPDQFKLGQFLVSFSLRPLQFEGTWKCVPNYNQADLRQALESLFSKGLNNLLIQINQQIYAVWKKNNFIYLLDPYRHRVIPADGTEPRTASLRVFRTLEAFFDMFNLILLSSNRTSQFYIHTIQVKKIELLDTKDCIVVTEEAPADELEVKSLNEAICFNVDDFQCLEDLGGLSDDEEEDSLEEEEVPESESEPELGEEEGEGGGAVEDIVDVESSDDGGIDDRRNRNKGVGSNKKRKGAEKKKKRKRDMSERNKRPRKDSTNSEVTDGKTKDTKNDEKPNTTPNMNNPEPKNNTNPPPKNIEPKTNANVDSKVDVPKPNATVDLKPNTKTDLKVGGNVTPKPNADADFKPPHIADIKHNPDTGSKVGGNVELNLNPNSTKGFESYKKNEDSPKRKLSMDEPKDVKPNERRSIIKDVKDPKKEEDSDSDEPRSSCIKHNYPVQSMVAHDMAIVASESGCFDSICKLLRAGFKCADRILTITPHGNFVVFRCDIMCHRRYYVYDGCTCNIEKFRHLDLNCGTEGLLSFRNLHDTIQYMIDTRKIRANLKLSRKHMIDKICHTNTTSYKISKISCPPSAPNVDE